MNDKVLKAIVFHILKTCLLIDFIENPYNFGGYNAILFWILKISTKGRRSTRLAEHGCDL